VAAICKHRFTLPVFFDLGFSKENSITSLEMRMKCGVGKCGRCNMGRKYVCKDGPVCSLADASSRKTFFVNYDIIDLR
jgi:hypothetical protein